MFDADDYSPLNPALSGFAPAGAAFEGVLEDEEERAVILFEVLEKDSEERFDKTGFSYALYRFHDSTEYCVELKELRVIRAKVNSEYGPRLESYGLIACVCEQSADEFASILTAILDSFYY